MRAPERGTSRRGTGALPRVTLAVALLALAALGTAARAGTRFSAAGMLTAGGAPFTVAAGAGLIAAACLTVAALLMARRRRGGWLLAGRAAIRWQRLVASLATLAVAAWLASIWVHGGRRRHQLPPPGPPPRLPAARPVPGDQVQAAVALALVAAAAVVIAAAVIWRRRHRPAGTAAAAEPASTLAAAVTAGSAALDRVTDARQAIIACYAAMEEALAAAGAPRRAADTPEELLGRAHRGGVLRTPAAGRLAGLFREARFSTHLLGDPEREAAALALSDISGELGGRS